MQRLADDKSISLRFDVLEPVSIQGDKEHLQRLLLNLVDNAIKYTPPGGSVTLSLRCGGNQALVGVTDTGIGLSRDEQSQVFTRFYRASRSQVTKRRWRRSRSLYRPIHCRSPRRQDRD